MTGTIRPKSTAMLSLWFTMGFLICGVPVATAQEATPESHPRVEFSIGTWISTGDTRWAHDASSIAGLGNPSSKLTYKDVGTNVVELTGKLWLTPKWFGRLNGGTAGIGGGRLTDDDYGSVGGQRLFSRTNSDISGDSMWYLNVDSGVRVVEYPNGRGWLEVFGGYQYWHTKYQATGLTQVACDNSAVPGSLNIQCNPAGTVGFQGQTVITNTSNWHSIRVGSSTEYRLTRRVSFTGTAAVLPLSIIDNQDIHHQRADLRQSPNSISMLGWGVGADADVAVKLMLIKNVFLSAGYRVWWNHAVDGAVTFHNANGSSQSFPLTQFDSLRHGPTAGLNFAF